MYTILVDPLEFGVGCRQLLKVLELQKIQTRPLWQPIHLSPAHVVKGAQSLHVAEHLADHALSLPCSVNLSEQDQDRVIEAITAAAGTRND
ncbi:MAG: DegT/DnrJ/EryC1/StrS family aminotransferase, partial [Terracidiphilus sp.]